MEKQLSRRRQRPEQKEKPEAGIVLGSAATPNIDTRLVGARHVDESENLGALEFCYCATEKKASITDHGLACTDQ
jgi:hypothetical protein